MSTANITSGVCSMTLRPIEQVLVPANFQQLGTVEMALDEITVASPRIGRSA